MFARGHAASFLLLSSLLAGWVAACSNDRDTPIPDTPDGGSGGTTTVTNGGAGGVTSSASATTSTSSVSTTTSTGAGGNPGFQGGTRLDPRYIDGSDGSRHFIGFHDTLKQVDCSFRPASVCGSELRCYPIQEPMASLGVTYSLTNVYTDAACSNQVTAVAVPICATSAPTHIAVPGTTVNTTWEVLGAITGYAMLTSCVALGDYWQLSEVPLTDWVEGTYVVP